MKLTLAVAGILVAAGLCGALVVGQHHDGFHLSRLALTGHTQNCPFGNAIRSSDHLRDLERSKDRILAGSKLLQTDADGYEQWDTPKGRYWIPKGSRFVLPFNLAEQDQRIYGEGEHFVHPGDIVLDCGANVGVFVRSALDAGAKQVIAIEPAPENLVCLRRNFAAEAQAGKVVFVPKGVWDHDDTLEIRVVPNNSAADTFVLNPDGSRQGARVPLVPVDELVRDLHLPRVDFIKMDIEGAEPKALAGAKATLAQYHPRLAVSAYHQPDHPTVIPNVIRAGWSGYQQECGPCALTPGGLIRPDVLRFY